MVTFEEIFPYVLAPFIVFSMQYIITRFFEIRDKKKKKSIWLKFLRKTNKSVNNCLSMLEKIEYSNAKWIELSRPIILVFSYVGIIILVSFISIFTQNIYISIAYGNFIICFFIFLLVLKLCKFTREKIKLGDVLNKSNEILDFYTSINWLFLGIISFIIPSSYLTIENLNQIPISDLGEIRMLSLFSISLIIVVSFQIVIKFRGYFFDNLKSEINTRYLKDFPIIHISTSVETLEGKISYIFDEDFILLENDRVIKGTQWDEIIIISF